MKLLIAAIAASLIAGCAGSFRGVCGFLPMGKGDSGVGFVRVICEPEE